MPPHTRVSVTPPIAPLELFVAFSRVTLVSFGGALFWSRRMLLEEKRWLTEQEFVELLALAQLLPGGNGLNLAVIVGYRLGGLTGAAASLAGFIAAPSVVISLLAVLHQRYGELALVQDTLAGMASVAVGLLIAMAVKMMSVLRRRWLPWVFAALAFAGVGLMRWPLIAVVAGLAPFAIAAAWRDRR
jgi:chromate transporter